MGRKSTKMVTQRVQGKTGYVVIGEDGIVGSGTCKALVRAIQIELGIGTPNGTFGPATISAFNALLKTLEEPPEYVTIILIGSIP